MNYHFSSFYKYSVLYLFFFVQTIENQKCALRILAECFFLYMKVISCK